MDKCTTAINILRVRCLCHEPDLNNTMKLMCNILRFLNFHFLFLFLFLSHFNKSLMTMYKVVYNCPYDQSSFKNYIIKKIHHWSKLIFISDQTSVSNIWLILIQWWFLMYLITIIGIQLTIVQQLILVRIKILT